jgi:streptogramin lyase
MGRAAPAWIGALPLLVACATPAPVFREAAPPSDQERFCAWFGDARDGVLYFGESAFWSEYRSHGNDPAADLLVNGPKRIGRFDLKREEMLDPLAVGEKAPSGTWDVLAHPNGRIYFTSFFEPAGWIDPATGEIGSLTALGDGLNELALGPDGTILATRYASSRSRNGAVVQFDPDGRLIAEYPLQGPPGYFAAAKSIAWDPIRRRIWVNTDLHPQGNDPVRYDARVFDEHGHEILRYETPWLHFMSFGPDGTGYFAEVVDRVLQLRIVPPDLKDPDPLAGRVVVLDPDFPREFDTAQDIRAAPNGRVAVTRWSGRIHIVGPEDRVKTLDFPRPDANGLFYTGELTDGRVCVTYCADVTVVCAPSR